MQLNILPDTKNSYAINGVFIKGDSLQSWLVELKSMDVNFALAEVYALPGNLPNTVWGCLVILGKGIAQPKKNTPAQGIGDKLYIPAYTTLYPSISTEELVMMCADRKYAFHPDFGFAELGSTVDWSALLTKPAETACEVKSPASGLKLPGDLRRLMVKELPPEEVLKVMDATNSSLPQPIKQEPLSALEKIKMNLLQKVLGDEKDSGEVNSGGSSVFWSTLEKLLPVGGSEGIKSRWKEDLKNLEERNKKEFEKLMDMLKKNPLEALKYAIPLDTDGTARGERIGDEALFKLSKLWNSFGFLEGGASSASGGGISVLPDDGYWKLQQQYEETAKTLIDQKEFRKAAFVYIKLLKNHQKAAETLEKGKIYDEAAAVYIKHLHNKLKAAECYEKGNMIDAAIKIHKELEAFEKVGDLYLQLNMKKDAREYFKKEIDRYNDRNQFVKAALIYKNKMNEIEPAAELLIQGWKKNQDAVNCLNNYFALYHGSKKLTEKINKVYMDGDKEANKLNFFNALKLQYGQSEEVNELAKKIAFEIVSEHAASNPALLDDLKIFKPGDKLFIKDVMKFRTKK